MTGETPPHPRANHHLDAGSCYVELPDDGEALDTDAQSAVNSPRSAADVWEGRPPQEESPVYGPHPRGIGSDNLAR